MLALIDGDVLRYEVGSIGQNPDEIMSFDYVSRVLDEKIQAILDATEATSPVIYLSGEGNFRDQIAVSKPYKGQRKQEKPWHFKNITVYLKNQYEVVISEGMEADDLMSIRQYQNWASNKLDDTIICTRDKDLRMIPGWHYGWECGAQREYHKRFVKDGGDMEFEVARNKITGTGMTFFYIQMLIGDSTDNIPGCPGIGPKKAYDLLKDKHTDEMWEIVYDTYKKKELPDEYILEQGQLLWMTRELNPDGTPVLWQMPY